MGLNQYIYRHKKDSNGMNIVIAHNYMYWRKDFMIEEYMRTLYNTKYTHDNGGGDISDDGIMPMPLSADDLDAFRQFLINNYFLDTNREWMLPAKLIFPAADDSSWNAMFASWDKRRTQMLKLYEQQLSVINTYQHICDEDIIDDALYNIDMIQKISDACNTSHEYNYFYSSSTNNVRQ